MSTSPELISPPVSPDRARELVLALERRGLDTSRIHIDTAPPVTTTETSRVDRRAVGRPGRRVAIGLAAGLAVGLLVGLVASAILDSSTGGAVLAITIGAAVLGGLIGLYSQLPMSAEISDADGSRLSAVRVDISDLDETDVDAIAEELNAR